MAKLEEARETARKNLDENEIRLENGVKLSETKEEVKAEKEAEENKAEVKEPVTVEESKEEEKKEEVSEPKIDIPEIPLTPDVPVAPVEPITAPVINPSVPEINTPNNDFVAPSVGQETIGNSQMSSVSDSGFNFASNMDISKTVSNNNLDSPDDVNEFLTGYYDMKKRHEEEENNYIKSFTDKVTGVINDRNNLKGGQQKLINILSGGESSMGPSFSQDSSNAFRK